MARKAGHGTRTGTASLSVLRRADFLADAHVRGFLRWARPLLDAELPIGFEAWYEDGGGGIDLSRGAGATSFYHHYVHRKPRYQWWCFSLIHAAAQYRFLIKRGYAREAGPGDPKRREIWAGHDSLRANAAVLDWLARPLRAGSHLFKKPKHRELANRQATAAARAIQHWGGTTKGNLDAIAALNSGGRHFCEYLQLCRKSFGNGTILDTQVFNGTGYELRSNAGFTKIYSLLFDDFAIYDSRVAAALGMLVARYLQAQRAPAVPASLNFGWMASQAGERRDPSVGTLKFDRLNSKPTGHLKHVSSNVRANWLLVEWLKGSRFETFVTSNPYWFPVKPLRALEAALFMIGYELAGNDPY